MAETHRNAVSNFRRRLQQKAMARLEVRVRKDDVPLVWEVVRMLTSPEQE